MRGEGYGGLIVWIEGTFLVDDILLAEITGGWANGCALLFTITLGGDGTIWTFVGLGCRIVIGPSIIRELVGCWTANTGFWMILLRVLGIGWVYLASSRNIIELCGLTIIPGIVAIGALWTYEIILERTALWTCWSDDKFTEYWYGGGFPTIWVTFLEGAKLTAIPVFGGVIARLEIPIDWPSW